MYEFCDLLRVNNTYRKIFLVNKVVVWIMMMIEFLLNYKNLIFIGFLLNCFIA